MDGQANHVLIAQQLDEIQEDVMRMPNKPSKAQTRVIINELYEVMRQLSALAE